MTGSFQVHFYQRWQHLRDPHVRALAGLLESPDLLDPAAACWQGQVATLPAPDAVLAQWIQALDDDPAPLLAALGARLPSRLGLYAERLIVFYLQHMGTLVAHNVQVRDGPHKTIGEFDLLLDDGTGLGLVHWELATKFYLLAPQSDPALPGAFVGPNLADTLGLKLQKILRHQLTLSSHPAAAAMLPRPVTAARMLVRGWLFYHDAVALPASLGVAGNHCRGFWCTANALAGREEEGFLLPGRLQWLSPAVADHCLTRQQVLEQVRDMLAVSDAPVMVAACQYQDGQWREMERGFVVPDGWDTRAAETVRHGIW